MFNAELQQLSLTYVLLFGENSHIDANYSQLVSTIHANSQICSFNEIFEMIEMYLSPTIECLINKSRSCVSFLGEF